jgi:hypothetical protein
VCSQNRYRTFQNQPFGIIPFDHITDKGMFPWKGQYQVNIFIVNELAKGFVKIVGGDKIKFRIELPEHI